MRSSLCDLLGSSHSKALTIEPMQATNGLDPTRRLHVLGYCRCVSSLSEVVEAAVLQRGGEVFWQDLRAHRRATPCGCCCRRSMRPC